jgi:hypothetical protein
VHRLLDEELEDGGSHISTRTSAAAPPVVPAPRASLVPLVVVMGIMVAATSAAGFTWFSHISSDILDTLTIYRYCTKV